MKNRLILDGDTWTTVTEGGPDGPQRKTHKDREAAEIALGRRKAPKPADPADVGAMKAEKAVAEAKADPEKGPSKPGVATVKRHG